MQSTQADLFMLFPGSAGGRSIRDQRGHIYLAELGAAGGAATLSKYGRAHLAQLGEKGRASQRRLAELPYTAELAGEVARVIPWHPHRGSSFYSPRRRRPILVRVELGAGDE